MQVTFEINDNLSQKELYDVYELMEWASLTLDPKMLAILSNVARLQNDKPRRKRTKADREQRAQIYGLESYKHVAL